MDPMSSPPSHGNPTTFGGHINTSLSQGVLLTARGWEHQPRQPPGCGKHQEQAVVLPDGFPNPGMEGRAPPACSLHCEFQG